MFEKLENWMKFMMKRISTLSYELSDLRMEVRRPEPMYASAAWNRKYIPTEDLDLYD